MTHKYNINDTLYYSTKNGIIKSKVIRITIEDKVKYTLEPVNKGLSAEFFRSVMPENRVSDSLDGLKEILFDANNIL